MCDEVNRIQAGPAAGESSFMGSPVVLQALDDAGVVANNGVHGVALKAADMLQHTMQKHINFQEQRNSYICL